MATLNKLGKVAINDASAVRGREGQNLVEDVPSAPHRRISLAGERGIASRELKAGVILANSSSISADRILVVLCQKLPNVGGAFTSGLAKPAKPESEKRAPRLAGW